MVDKAMNGRGVEVHIESSATGWRGDADKIQGQAESLQMPQGFLKCRLHRGGFPCARGTKQQQAQGLHRPGPAL